MLLVLLIGGGCASVAPPSPTSPAAPVTWRDEDSEQIRADGDTQAILLRFGWPIMHYNSDGRMYHLVGHVFAAGTREHPKRVLQIWEPANGPIVDAYWGTVGEWDSGPPPDIGGSLAPITAPVPLPPPRTQPPRPPLPPPKPKESY
jgi:hypothetical protein